MTASSGFVLPPGGGGAPAPGGVLPAGTVNDSMLGWDVATSAWLEQTSLTYDETARMLRVAWANLSGAPSGYEVTRDHGAGEVVRARFGLVANEDAALTAHDTTGTEVGRVHFDFSLLRWEIGVGNSLSQQLIVENSAGQGQLVRVDATFVQEAFKSLTLAAGDNNNVTPAYPVYLWRLTPAATGSTITGIAPVALLDRGVQLLLANVDTAANITIKHESASSSASNRIITPGGLSSTILPGGCRLLHYDESSNRWRMLGG